MKIWVTGIGIVSPLGHGAPVTMRRLRAGDRAFRKVSLFEISGTRSSIAAEVTDVTPDLVGAGGADAGWSRTDTMSIMAAREALAEAGLVMGQDAIDLAIGGTTAGMYETEDLLAQLAKDPGAMSPLRRMLSHPLSSTGDHVREVVGPFGRVRTICSACSSGANALIVASSWLRSGRSTAVLAGGADGLCRLTFTGFGALSALSPEPCRPFDKNRTGLNLGEGAAFLVLEPAHLVVQRGGQPIASLSGYAVGAEAHHITNPESSGASASRIMRQAIHRAGLSPADIDYINAHGTATPLNDAMEAKAIRACFGSDADRVAVSSSKGQIGHTLGAAGAIEAAICAMTVRDGIVPPTIGLTEVDSACKLAHVTEAREQRVRAAMSNSFGFGGTDTVLVFAEPGEPDAPTKTRRAVCVTGGAVIGPLGVLSTMQSAQYLEEGEPPSPGPIDFNAKEHLDVGRARRLDRAGRLATVAIQAALTEAGQDVEAPRSGDEPAGYPDVGAIVGTSFGSVDASTAYMRRIYDRGAKFASPADFPNLVPSSPVGHASIYLRLRGPVFAVSDLGTTAEAAVITAAQLIESGEADALVAGSVEEASPTIELVLGPLCSGTTSGDVRGEGAAVVFLEDRDRAVQRGAQIMANLDWWAEWREAETSTGDPRLPRDAARNALADVPAPDLGRSVVLSADPERVVDLLSGTAWANVPVRSVKQRAGSHEGIGGVAISAGVSFLSSGAPVDSVLVVGLAKHRGMALYLKRDSSERQASA